MRNLASRLNRLEARRHRKWVPRVVIRYQQPDGSTRITESRPAEDDEEDFTEVVVQFVGTENLKDRFNRPETDARRSHPDESH